MEHRIKKLEQILMNHRFASNNNVHLVSFSSKSQKPKGLPAIHHSNRSKDEEYLFYFYFVTLLLCLFVAL